MKSIGATIAKNEATDAEVAAIRKFANSLGRSIQPGDARIITGARKINATVITRDAKLLKAVRAFGWNIKSF